MNVFEIVLIILFVIISVLIILFLYKILDHLNKTHNIQNIENTEQIEQYSDETDGSLIGKKVVIDDIRCTIIDVNEFGVPCAWISDVLPLNIEPPYNWCSREDAMALKFNNGWHIPSYSELLKYKQNIMTSCGSVICWTTTFYDGMCYYGNPNDIFGSRRNVRIIKTI